jgi:hypothetical protein
MQLKCFQGNFKKKHTITAFSYDLKAILGQLCISCEIKQEHN